MRQMLALAAVVCVVINFRKSQSAILRTGNPLAWRSSKRFLQHVRTSGVQQFLVHYNRTKDIQTPDFLWGDEIEYGIFKRDSDGHFDLSMRGTDIRQTLAELEKGYKGLKAGCEWQPEYGSWMVEAVPRDPYSGFVSSLFDVEKNMQLRRTRMHAVLHDDEIAPSTSNFPMLGVEGYGHAEAAGGPVANSRFVSDAVINPHPRFGTLTRNIRYIISLTFPSSRLPTVSPSI